ncbi:MAG: hypothetical protein DRJ47_06710 [Thermoprotei archaeon]|nr:MAG: hypothetical protein DRJ47_06710 [Thermoprotei archaeon]
MSEEKSYFIVKVRNVSGRSKLTGKQQIGIAFPKAVVEALELSKGDQVMLILRGKEVLLRKAEEL